MPFSNAVDPGPGPTVTLHRWMNVYQTSSGEYEFGDPHNLYEDALTNPGRGQRFQRVGIAHVIWSADKPYPEELPDES